MAAHAMTVNTNRATLWTGWAFRATCACGWESGNLFMSKKAVHRAYRRHIGEFKPRLVFPSFEGANYMYDRSIVARRAVAALTTEADN